MARYKITIGTSKRKAKGMVPGLRLEWIEANKHTAKFQQLVRRAWSTYFLKLNGAYGKQYRTGAKAASVDYGKTFVAGKAKPDAGFGGSLPTFEKGSKASDNTSAARRSRMVQRGWYPRAGVLGQPSHKASVVTEERLMLSQELYTTVTSCRLSFENLEPGDIFDILTPDNEDSYKALDLDVNGADRNYLLSKFLTKKFGFIHTPMPEGYDVGETAYELAETKMTESLLELQNKDKSGKSKKKTKKR